MVILRAMVRLLWLAWELFAALCSWVPRLAFSPCRRTARARWLQSTARRVLRVLNVELEVDGLVPVSGLLVSNHLSYLDIPLIASLAPAVFVAKSEVAVWPVFGWFAKMAGTLFIRREKRTDVGRVGSKIQNQLDQGQLTVIFPEGTSSDGHTVLPFRSALLESATASDISITVACMDYRLPDGDAAREVCYWGDMTLAPHLLNLLRKKKIHARIRFARIGDKKANRKELAEQLHGEVIQLHRRILSSAHSIHRPKSSE